MKTNSCLYITACPSKSDRLLGLLLSHIPAVSFDADAAVSYGVLAVAVRDRRRDALDRLIAAHAVSLSVTLVTNNEADFKDYPGLVVENWVNQSD
jgi:tRNA(fMet)-specific endonuclease VapC